MKCKYGYNPCRCCDLGDSRSHGVPVHNLDSLLTMAEKMRVKDIESAIRMIRNIRGIEVDDTTFITPKRWSLDMKARLDAMLYEYTKEHKTIIERAR